MVILVTGHCGPIVETVGVTAWAQDQQIFEHREDHLMTDTNVNDWNAQIIGEFRANGGKVGGQFEGAPVLLLHTTGAKSGAERVNPVMYLELDARVFVFASKAGAPSNPDWYHNLVANPDVTVELGTEQFSARALPLEEEERIRVYDEQARRYPGFREYQDNTERVIPVVELTRA
ncbi:MAG: nitroreductase family deazaflavin-dependent oxidoreductase [Acidimicrobiales bacterium]